MLRSGFKKRGVEGGGWRRTQPFSAGKQSVVSDSEETVHGRVTQVPLPRTQSIIPRAGTPPR